MLNGPVDGIRTVMIEESDDDFRPLHPIHVATTIMFLSGIFHIILGICRADFLSCYLSEQVMSGFVIGGYVHVFFSQIGETLGIKLPVRSGPGSLFYRVLDLFEHLHEFQPATLIISSASIVFLIFSRWVIEPWLNSVFVIPIPYELLLVIVGITATNYADLSNRHAVTVVGNIPTNFPPPALPRFDLISSIFVTTLGITIVTVAIHLTVVKIVENRYHHRINSCKELYALGFVSVLSSAFPVFPVTSIFARTLVGSADKNTTQLTTFFSSLALLAVVLYIGPALEYLPKCILASIILVSLTACFDRIIELRKLWPLFKTDLIIFLVTLLLTVCYELAKGLIAAVVFAVLTTVVRNQCSSWHILIHDSEVNEFREVPKQQLNEIESHACVFRFDGALIFTSVQKFATGVRKAVKHWEKREINAVRTDDAGCKWRIRPRSRRRRSSDSELDKHGGHLKPTILIIDCSGFPYIDYLGLCTLKRVSRVMTALLRMFENTDFYSDVPHGRVYRSVRLAIMDEDVILKPPQPCSSLPLNLDQQTSISNEETGSDRLIENERKSSLDSDEFTNN
ncbi:Sulfate permease family protein 3 [Aphelenchoides besseyi]|nr:Sulfate permease family protein 3 [Aphelenchoides besseyi]